MFQPVALEPCPGKDPAAVVVGSDENDTVAAPHEKIACWARDAGQSNGGDGRFVHLNPLHSSEGVKSHSHGKSLWQCDDRTPPQPEGRWARGTKTVGVELGRSAEILLSGELGDDVAGDAILGRGPGQRHPDEVLIRELPFTHFRGNT